MKYSLEARHPIWVWIMKVKEPKNQADFIEVLCVVLNVQTTVRGPMDPGQHSDGCKS